MSRDFKRQRDPVKTAKYAQHLTKHRRDERTKTVRTVFSRNNVTHSVKTLGDESAPDVWFPSCC